MFFKGVFAVFALVNHAVKDQPLPFKRLIKSAARASQVPILHRAGFKEFLYPRNIFIVGVETYIRFLFQKEEVRFSASPTGSPSVPAETG